MRNTGPITLSITLCGDAATPLAAWRHLPGWGIPPSLPMSESALAAFASSVSSDPQLRQKLDAATGLDDVVAIAQTHGHSFSKATLLRAHASAVAAAPDHTLEGLNSWGDALMHCFGASDND